MKVVCAFAPPHSKRWGEGSELSEKGRDITLLMKVRLVKAVIFPVVMYGCWIIKTECRRIDAFELWGWRRLLRVTWMARRSNQSILKELNL